MKVLKEYSWFDRIYSITFASLREWYYYNFENVSIIDCNEVLPVSLETEYVILNNAYENADKVDTLISTFTNVTFMVCDEDTIHLRKLGICLIYELELFSEYDKFTWVTC